MLYGRWCFRTDAGSLGFARDDRVGVVSAAGVPCDVVKCCRAGDVSRRAAGPLGFARDDRVSGVGRVGGVSSGGAFGGGVSRDGSAALAAMVKTCYWADSLIS